MGKKRKSPFAEATTKEMRRLDDLKYLPGADFDAVSRAQSQLAIAAKLRTPGKRTKSLEQQIEIAEQKAAARETKERQREEKLKRDRANAKKARAKKKAKKAGKA